MSLNSYTNPLGSARGSIIQDLSIRPQAGWVFVNQRRSPSGAEVAHSPSE